VQAVAEHFEGIRKLVPTEHAGVHEDVGELVAHGAMDEDGGDRGIHAAAEGTDGPFVADFFLNGLRGLFDEGGAAPFGFGFANAKKEIAQDLRAVFRVIHLHMELYGVDSFAGVFEGGNGVGGFRRSAKTFG